jgi:hypothetical protein
MLKEGAEREPSRERVPAPDDRNDVVGIGALPGACASHAAARPCSNACPVDRAPTGRFDRRFDHMGPGITAGARTGATRRPGCRAAAARGADTFPVRRRIRVAALDA